MSATIKVALRCDGYDGRTYEQCDATADGTIDMRRLTLADEPIAWVDCPKGWRIRYEPDPSGPGEHRVSCPDHNKDP